MSRIFDFIKRRPRKVEQVVRFKTTEPVGDNDNKIADALAILENNNEHQAYRDLQARYNVPNSEVLKAYRRLGLD